MNDKINDLLQPLAEQIEDIAKHLEETANKSEVVLTLSQSTKLETDVMKERLLILETSAKKQNLKFRGFQEDPNETPDLMNIMTNWLVDILQYLPSEALQIRQKLKQTTQRLRDERIMYRWSTPGKLTVRHHGKLYHATDEDSGLSLLQDLNLLPPSEKPKRSTKRRLSMTLSPFKASKVPIRIMPSKIEKQPEEKKRVEDKIT
ncbi:UNVERIFIED_CONTAM: hypothetical protein K2H54_004097 [Gekko kuhli]